MAFLAARASDPGAGEGAQGKSGCRGVVRVFLFSRGFGRPRRLWRGLAVSGCRSVPDSGGEEPPIRAVIRVRLAALSGPDSEVDS